MAGQLTAFGSPLMGIWTSALDGPHCFAPGGPLICEVRMPGVATKPVFAELPPQPVVHHRGNAFYAVYLRTRAHSTRETGSRSLRDDTRISDVEG